MKSTKIDVHTFIACEDIREEINGKPSLMGVYPGAHIHVPRGHADEGRSLASLCFYILLTGVSGKCAVNVGLAGPQGPIGKEASDVTTVPPEVKFHAIQLKLTPFKLQGIGDYKIKLKVDDWEHLFVFTIVSE